MSYRRLLPTGLCRLVLIRKSIDGQNVCHVETYNETYGGENAISDKTFYGTECTFDQRV